MHMREKLISEKHVHFWAIQKVSKCQCETALRFLGGELGFGEGHDVFDRYTSWVVEGENNE